MLVLCADSYKSECGREPSSKGGHRCGQFVRLSVLQHTVCKLLSTEVAHGDSQRRTGDVSEMICQLISCYEAEASCHVEVLQCIVSRILAYHLM